MPGKKQYYVLDEIGFLGTQKTRTAAQVKTDIEKMTQSIKASKSGKLLSTGKRTTRLVSKAKQFCIIHCLQHYLSLNHN